ncbi:MAG: glycosyltransferase [Cryomorphaceae bacterium]
MEQAIKVSVCCVVYNHVEFLKTTLESFVNQKTDFQFEVLVHDDASTDGSQEIIRAFADAYPSIIKPIYQDENQWKLNNRNPLIHELFPKAKGKYIALCEGDDFWTSTDKLQSQVDFLDHNPEFSAICANSEVWEKDRVTYDYKNIKWNWLGRSFSDELTVYDLSTHLFPHTSSWLFVNDFELSEDHETFVVGDVPLFLLMADKGRIKYVDRVLSVYRQHGGGVTNELRKRHALEHVNSLSEMLLSLDAFMGHRHSLSLKKATIELHAIALRDHASIGNLSRALKQLNDWGLLGTQSLYRLTLAFCQGLAQRIKRQFSKRFKSITPSAKSE